MNAKLMIKIASINGFIQIFSVNDKNLV